MSRPSCGECTSRGYPNCSYEVKLTWLGKSSKSSQAKQPLDEARFNDIANVPDKNDRPLSVSPSLLQLDGVPFPAPDQARRTSSAFGSPSHTNSNLNQNTVFKVTSTQATNGPYGEQDRQQVPWCQNTNGTLFLCHPPGRYPTMYPNHLHTGDGGITEPPFDANIAGDGELEFWNILLENSNSGFDASPVQFSGSMFNGISSGKKL
jgi:hypothetical protein